MKKLFKNFAILLSFFSTTGAYATSYQVFANITFSNPAALNSIKEGELIVGGTPLSSRFHFTGTAAGVGGSATSRTADVMPYGRIAMRLTPKLVAGIDITQPYYTNIQYPRNSIVNLFATETFIRDTNFSPRLSYQATERLALGIGFDANNLYNGQINFSVPPFGVVTNKADSWAYGWDIGLFYVITPSTFLNLSYFSKIIQHLDGTSTWGPFVNNALSAEGKLPATFIGNITQMISPPWALSATLRYTQWDILRYTVIQHTALGTTVTVPDHFFNNVSAQLATHYQANDKWAVIGAIDYQPNVQPTGTRNVGLPTYTLVIPAVGAEYGITKELKAKLLYAHVFSKAPIDMSISTGQHLHGHEYVNIDAIDFSITYDV